MHVAYIHTYIPKNKWNQLLREFTIQQGFKRRGRGREEGGGREGGLHEGNLYGTCHKIAYRFHHPQVLQLLKNN